MSEQMMTHYRIALAGNPNVGKSTVFNALTGMHQHTGNWAGKTVTSAEGIFEYRDALFQLIDLPGTYSLRANSAEEQVARDYLCFEAPDAVVIVCDACCLERNLCLVLQVMELSERVIVVVNLADEAEKKGICVDTERLGSLLNVPVVKMSAREGKGIDTLLEALHNVLQQPVSHETRPQPDYGTVLEERLKVLTGLLEQEQLPVPAEWAALRILEQDKAFAEWLTHQELPPHLLSHICELQDNLSKIGWQPEQIQDAVIAAIIRHAEEIASQVVCGMAASDQTDRKADKVLADKRFGIPIMLALLAGILWMTMIGANYPSTALSTVLFSAGEHIRHLLVVCDVPDWCISVLIDGIFRVLAWVISVMLPPMAVFFPLFTLLEDAGYLPRVAFLMDSHFRKAGTCGKQSLTMCMGLGCNACGVTGCRIIDSPRERMIAILTNCFVPCNGRFPLLIAMISMFFVTGNALDSVLSAVLLLAVILCGVGMTLLVSRILSRTILKGFPSSFTLELPPYRRPQIGKVLVRSVLDRTVFVLGRACAVAAPAGLVIWLLANICIGDASILAHCTAFLDPFAAWFGMDGTILLAFILGFPANEIVIPIILMGYMAQGSLVELDDLHALHTILTEHGWTWVTALCTMLFSLFHFPCSTTVLTIRKETGSLRWTAFSILLPTVCGLVICFAIHLIGMIFL